MGIFRKVPVTVEALRWSGNHNLKEIRAFIGKPIITEIFSETAYIASQGPPLFNIIIPTKEGTMVANPGDWIIKEPFPTGDRDFYPCKHQIFMQTYEPVQSTSGDEPNNVPKDPVSDIL